jgi:CDP-glucose 4,6-dehydratase
MENSLGKLLKQQDGPVLITGHTGFKGTWLTMLLENLGIRVVGLSLPPLNNSLYNRANRIGKIREYFSDISDLDSTQGIVNKIKPSAIVHLAAQPLVLESYNKPLETFSVNVMGTANVLEAAFKCGSVKAILVATTDKVYENLENDKSFIESDPLKGSDPYSCSKVATESVVSAWQEISSKFEGPNLISVRSGNVIGGGDLANNRIMTDLINGFKDKTDIIIRNPNSTRPWQHVLDTSIGYTMAIEKIIEKKPDFKSLNFGPESKGYTVKYVAEYAESIWPSKTLIKFAENTNLLESKFLNLNSSLAHEILGWFPVLSQDEAIKKTITWWKRNLFENISANELCNEEIEDVRYLLSLKNLGSKHG